MGLNDRDIDLLAALSAGESINDYARRNNYTLSWGVYASRKIRDHFGVKTIREAVAMADDEQGVSRADFDKLTGLVSRLGESLEELVRRPNDPVAREQVQQRELDVKDHAKALGLSLEDVEKLRGEKEYEKFKSMQERLDAERDEQLNSDDEDDGEGNGKGVVEQIRDGLGGFRNVKQQ